MKFVKVRPRKWWSIKAWKNAKALQELDNYILSHRTLFNATCPKCDKQASWIITAPYQIGICLNCCNVVFYREC